MSDEHGQRGQDPPPPTTTLAYQVPSRLRRRPVAGAFAILAAILCGGIGSICTGVAIGVLMNGNLIGGGMGAFYAVSFLIVSATLVRTAVTMIRGTPDGDTPP